MARIPSLTDVEMTGAELDQALERPSPSASRYSQPSAGAQKPARATRSWASNTTALRCAAISGYSSKPSILRNSASDMTSSPSLFP